MAGEVWSALWLMEVPVSKVTILDGGLFAVIGLLTPILDKLSGDVPITGRVIAIMVVAGLIGSANALKAFLSQSYVRPGQGRHQNQNQPTK